MKIVFHCKSILVHCTICGTWLFIWFKPQPEKWQWNLTSVSDCELHEVKINIKKLKVNKIRIPIKDYITGTDEMMCIRVQVDLLLFFEFYYQLSLNSCKPIHSDLQNSRQKLEQILVMDEFVSFFECKPWLYHHRNDQLTKIRKENIVKTILARKVLVKSYWKNVQHNNYFSFCTHFM